MDVKGICPFDGRVSEGRMRGRGQENPVGDEAGGRMSVRVDLDAMCRTEGGLR